MTVLISEAYRKQVSFDPRRYISSDWQPGRRSLTDHVPHVYLHLQEWEWQQDNPPQNLYEEVRAPT